MWRLFKWESLEIHPIDAGDAERGQRDRAQDGKNLHNLIRAVGHRGEVDVERVIEQITLRLYRVQQARDVVVRITHVRLLLGVDDRIRIALKVKRGVPCIDEDAAEGDEFTLNRKDALQYLG